MTGAGAVVAWVAGGAAITALITWQMVLSVKRQRRRTRLQKALDKAWRNP